MNFHEARQVNRSVDLGGCQRAVSEKLLNRSKIHTGLEKVGREGVAQGVRVKMTEVGGTPNSLFENPANRAIAQAPAPLVDEERIVFISRVLPPPARPVWQVRLDGFGRGFSEWHEALFAPLPMTTHVSTGAKHDVLTA